MTVIGIDPGSNNLGIAIGRVDDGIHLDKAMQVDPGKIAMSQVHGAKYLGVMALLDNLVKPFIGADSILFMEAGVIFSSKTGAHASQIITHEVRAPIKMWWWEVSRKDVVTIAPATFRVAVGLSGKAPKSKIAPAVRGLFPGKVIVGSDAADAVGVMYAGARILIEKSLQTKG